MAENDLARPRGSGLADVEFDDIRYFYRIVEDKFKNGKLERRDLLRLSIVIDAYYTANF